MTDADGEREGVSETLITLSKWPYNIVKQLYASKEWDKSRRVDV